jgi:hypothetical protein
MQDNHGVDVAIVAADRLAAAGGITWHNEGDHHVTLPTEEGGRVDVGTLDLLWWRRAHGRPTVPDSVTDPAMRKLVVKDNRSAIRGLSLSSFNGTWLSDPYATERAQNKLLQLTVARQVGLTVPRTLVSSDPDAIRAFTRTQGGTLIAKTLTGLLGTSLEAGRVPVESLVDDEDMSLTATIYQEEVPGTDHLRVMVFGDDVHVARIRSGALDWRLANDMEIEPIPAEPMLAAQLRAVVEQLGLRMGIFDLKVRPDGQVVFLEVNPQGQFLFVEGMSDMPLGDAFATFAAREMGLVAAAAH